jgi:hypothetical protein
MTFLKERRSEMLRTTTKPGVVFLALAAAVVSVGGCVLALAILAPEQLAEATVTASDVVCSGCVGTTDIADSAVTSAKIGSGQVKTTDLGASAVTSSKISDGTITSTDLASGAVQITRVLGNQVSVSPGDVGTAGAHCPAGKILTGGGIGTSGTNVRVLSSLPFDADTWLIQGVNQSSTQATLTPYALCV